MQNSLDARTTDAIPPNAKRLYHCGQDGRRGYDPTTVNGVEICYTCGMRVFSYPKDTPEPKQPILLTEYWIST